MSQVLRFSTGCDTAHCVVPPRVGRLGSANGPLFQKTAMPFWSLATSAPNREAWISFVLSALEIEHRIFYVRMADVVKPIFPGYVFVNADNFDLVKSVTGILGFVKID